MPDRLNYAEEYALSYENLVLLTQTHGNKSLDVKVYQIEDKVIYEVLSLKDGSKYNTWNYIEVFDL